MFVFIQLWDLDDLLQNTGDTQKDQDDATESDSDEMDVDTNPPRSKKGMLRFTLLEYTAILWLFRGINVNYKT